MLSIEQLYNQHKEALDQNGYTQIGSSQRGNHPLTDSLLDNFLKTYERCKVTRNPAMFYIKQQALLNDQKDDFKVVFNYIYKPQLHNLILINLYATYNQVSTSFPVNVLQDLPLFDTVLKTSEERYQLHPQKKFDDLKTSIADHLTTLIEKGFYKTDYYQFDNPEQDREKIIQAFKDALYDHLGANFPLQFSIECHGRSMLGESPMNVNYHFKYDPQAATIQLTCLLAQTEVKQIHYIRSKDDIPSLETLYQRSSRESNLLKKNDAFIERQSLRGKKR